MSPQRLPDGPFADFAPFAIARREHWALLQPFARELYGRELDPDALDLKPYQDLLALAFIRTCLPPGARLLEVGGGNSRVLAHLAGEYECWNVDRFEGVGNGPTEARDAGYRIVRDFMGGFNPELPDNHFDLVFSISVLEHVPDADTAHMDRVLDDMDRVLKPGGLSLHLLDILLKADHVWTSRMLPRMHETRPMLHPWLPLEPLRADAGVYHMTKSAYEAGWLAITREPFERFGRPTSANALWRKPEARPAPAKGSGGWPTISMVVPSFNQGAYLEQCLDSLLSQSYPALELVVMDGGSTDGSLEIIKRHAKHLAHWRSAPDQGQYWAVDQGLRQCGGDILGWLNSDDRHHPGSLFLLAALFEAFPEAEWLMGCPTVWDAAGNLTLALEPLPVWERKSYLEGRIGPPHIQQESTFWRRSLWERAGGRLDTHLGYAGDMELWARFFRQARLFTADVLLGGFRMQPDSKTATAMHRYDAEAAHVVAREADLARVAGSVPAPAPAPLMLDELLRRRPELARLPELSHLAEAWAAHADALRDPAQAGAMRRRAALFSAARGAAEGLA